MDTLEEIKLILKEVSIIQKETAAAQKENAEQFKDLEIQFKETGKYITKIGKQIGEIGEKFGYFTEGMALPSMEKILRQKFKINTVTPRFKRIFDDNTQIEYDVFGYCNGDVNNAVMVEIKSKLKEKHITEMLTELNQFKTIFPEYKDKHLYGILAAVDIQDKDIIQKVEENGIFFARISDEVFTMKNNLHPVDFNA